MTDELKDNVTNEINDKDLSDVNGGQELYPWNSSDKFYKSSDTPVYSVGTKLLTTKEHGIFTTEYLIKRATVIEVHTEKSGLIFLEFTYKIQYDDGRIEDGIYESALMKNWIRV